MNRRFLSLAVFVALFLSLAGASYAAVGGATGSATGDTVLPSDVERLSAIPGDRSVTLKWDEAFDETGVAGYKVYYGTKEVTAKNDAVYEKTVDVKNVLVYTVGDLQNGTKYWIAVTAYDVAGNESASYSPYVGVTPHTMIVADATTSAPETTTAVKKDAVVAVGAGGAVAGGPDTEAPRVVKAEATDKNHVRVTFSEQVVLPQVKPENAFSIQDNLSYEFLKATSVAQDATDTSGLNFIVTTEAQIPNSEYIVTVSSDVQDMAKNPISSGTSDTASFTGSANAAAPAAAPAAVVPATVPTADATSASATNPSAPDAFGIATVAAQNDTTVKVSFTKPVVLHIDPTENFSLYQKDDETKKLAISSIVVDDNKKDILITTAQQSPIAYMVKMTDVLDESGATLADGKDTLEFAGASGAVADTTPPEDVTGFMIKMVKKLMVKLGWNGSKNSAGDLAQYVVYRSTDAGKNYGVITSLGKENTAYELNESAPGSYYYKITAKDATGNESKGVVAKVRLVETGPELGLFVLMSVGLGRVFGKKKK